MSIVPLPVETTANDTRQAKVLHVINGEHYAGAERVQDLLGQELPALGFDVGYVCVKPDRFPQLREAAEAPLFRAAVRHPLDGPAVAAVARIIREHGYDLVHSHTPRSAWAAVPAARRAGVPVVHTMHDLSLTQDAGWVRRLVNRYTLKVLADADCLVAVSPAALAFAEQQQLGRSRQLILNGVPGPAELPPRAAPQTWTLGTVSLMRPCKGIEVLLEALALLRDAGEAVRLRAVGRFETSEYEQAILRKLQQLDLQQQVEFAGFTRDVPSALRRFDLFIMPSVGPEGLPMVVLEAMAYGVPVVGSDVPGVRDAIRDQTDGRLVPPGDPPQLAVAIRQMIHGSPDWQTARAAAFERYRNRFTSARMAADTADVYRQLPG